jgi:hypothetical protein
MVEGFGNLLHGNKEFSWSTFLAGSTWLKESGWLNVALLPGFSG